MKLVGELKEKVKNANTKEEAESILAEAGIQLTEEEFEKVAGGYAIPHAEHEYSGL